MLHEQITFFDILLIIQLLLTIAAIITAYKEGEKRGVEKANFRKHRKPHYRLPAKSKVVKKTVKRGQHERFRE